MFKEWKDFEKLILCFLLFFFFTFLDTYDGFHYFTLTSVHALLNP